MIGAINDRKTQGSAHMCDVYVTIFEARGRIVKMGASVLVLPIQDKGKDVEPLKFVIYSLFGYFICSDRLALSFISFLAKFTTLVIRRC